MQAVRQAGTDGELAVRRALTSLGLRYRINTRSLPGSPDLANRVQRFAIFVHGCFWHRHPGCPYASTPKSNRPFWREKFRANVRRDRKAIDALEELGFVVVVVWGCEAQRSDLAKILRAALDRRPTRGSRRSSR
jgi:DNA mismatch endonuclease (patch repair protein)